MEGLRKAGEFIFRKIKEEKKKKAEGGEGGGRISGEMMSSILPVTSRPFRTGFF